MAGELRRINIKEIVNYNENPRHAIAMGEKDTLKKLFESVGNQYMLNLAEDIKNYGLLGNQQLVVVYFDEIKKYIVYEGNRRVAAIKLLINPTYFDFLDKATRDKAEKISNQLINPIQEVLCYVTDEKEAFFIMERLHSGEDKGRGVKAWNAREKEAFKVRQSDQKSVAYLIDYYVKKHCDNFDITSIMPYTTIQRIFGNKEIKENIGLDLADENTFTEHKMKLIVNVAREIEESAKNEGVSVTRLFNRARQIEDKVLPLIEDYINDRITQTQDGKYEQAEEQERKQTETVKEEGNKKEISNEQNSEKLVNTSDEIYTNSVKNDILQQTSAGSIKNLPYFFLGINYSHLNPNDVDTHGIAEVCSELRYFSEKKLVDKLPIAAVFLIRSAIEQAIIYYSKKHCIQGQNKLIWENIRSISKLSKIIENYNRNLPNYITNTEMRKYFTALFDDYEKKVDPLNWVVHRPAEFQLDTITLVELPKRGLLTLVNYLIAE
ncbi:MAG: hypothetical protein E7261_06365 [Lachnospiraceae bacterium]|nr:hypothetical protein [Lachnospiraceae bacterium]